MIDLSRIKCIALDVDGTLTDGKIYYDSIGNEMKSFNVKDGMAISHAIKQGIEVVIITGRCSSIVEKRCSELGIKKIYQGAKDKVQVLDSIIKETNLEYENIFYIGDDINDLGIIHKVKYAGCPLNSALDVKASCDIISKYDGGNGAVREIIEYILKEQNKWIQLDREYSLIVQ